MAQSGIPILAEVGSMFGGKTKEQSIAEGLMKNQRDAFNRLDAERMLQQEQMKNNTSQRDARRRQKAASTSGTSRADTILTSPLGQVGQATTAKKTILGG